MSLLSHVDLSEILSNPNLTTHLINLIKNGKFSTPANTIALQTTMMAILEKKAQKVQNTLKDFLTQSTSSSILCAKKHQTPPMKERKEAVLHRLATYLSMPIVPEGQDISFGGEEVTHDLNLMEPMDVDEFEKNRCGYYFVEGVCEEGISSHFSNRHDNESNVHKSASPSLMLKQTNSEIQPLLNLEQTEKENQTSLKLDLPKIWYSYTTDSNYGLTPSFDLLQNSCLLLDEGAEVLEDTNPSNLQLDVEPNQLNISHYHKREVSKFPTRPLAALKPVYTSPHPSNNRTLVARAIQKKAQKKKRKRAPQNKNKRRRTKTNIISPLAEEIMKTTLESSNATVSSVSSTSSSVYHGNYNSKLPHSGYPNVSFDSGHHRWIAFWTFNGKSHSKSFSCNKFGGIEAAKLLAVEFRKKLDLNLFKIIRTINERNEIGKVNGMDDEVQVNGTKGVEEAEVKVEGADKPEAVSADEMSRTMGVGRRSCRSNVRLCKNETKLDRKDVRSRPKRKPKRAKGPPSSIAIIISGSITFDKSQNRFMTQWKTSNQLKHSRSFYIKEFGSYENARQKAIEFKNRLFTLENKY